MTPREIDALVAEKVMGYIVTVGVNPLMGKIESGSCMWFGELPHYSTDIGAAWTVIEKVYERTGSWILVCPINGRFVAYEMTGCADPDFGAFCEYADTAMMAICLAALKAVGVEVPA